MSLEKDINLFYLQKKYPDIWPIVAEYLACLPKAKNKLPVWTKAACIFTRQAYEQCTSELIATYKSSILPPGNVLSLTGGLGIDDWAFASVGNKVLSIESNPCLNELFTYNASLLSLANVERITTTAEEFLSTCNSQWSLIYLDPDRRATGSRINSNAKAYVPDAFALFAQYSHLATNWFIKLSPMTDLQWIQQQFNVPIDLFVLSVGAEVKEILASIGKESKGSIKMVVLNENQPAFTWEGETLAYENSKSPLFFEATAPCIKTGFNRRLKDIFPLQSINTNQTFFTGHCILPGAIMRSFTILQTVTGSLNTIYGELQNLAITKANVTVRNFSNTAEETKKILKLEDGGEIYLFLTGTGKFKQCFITEKRKTPTSNESLN